MDNQGIQSVAQQIVMDLTDIQPAISGQGMVEVSEKLKEVRNLARLLTARTVRPGQDIVDGYRRAAEDSMVGLCETAMRLDGRTPISDDKMVYIALVAEGFIMRLTEYQVKKWELIQKQGEA